MVDNNLDFEEFIFDDIDVSDLFWPTNTYASTNHAHRKLSDTTAVDTRNQIVVEVPLRQRVYQKI
ncbi:MAG: hypothetical protein QF864_07905 [SAR202 cluster bacterium]|jgi:hypothetical protein|nr:hypothetical protein [SAR202 cluster bacterium]|tara:strand:- start:5139 stop:5333 length:195 start_codon:yes stop_codon:yes gene_type:complete